MTCFNNNDYYPAGAANDPNAPYNQVDPEPKAFNVEVSLELYRTAEIESDNYSYDDDGGLQYEGNANEDFCVEFFNPLEIFADYVEMCTRALETAEKNNDTKLARVLRLKIDSAKGWGMNKPI